MNKIDQVIEMLRNGTKISRAIKEVYGNCKLYIPFNDKDFDIPIEELELSTRSNNALMRCRFKTLNDVIQYIDENGWNKIKNFGRTSAAEVFGRIIDVAWDGMNTTQKAEFLISIDEENQGGI